MLVVLISSTNQVLCGDKYMDMKQIRAKAKEFITNMNNNPNLPEKEEIDVPFFGKMMVTKSHIILLKNNRGTPKDDDQYGHDRDHVDQRSFSKNLQHHARGQGTNSLPMAHTFTNMSSRSM